MVQQSSVRALLAVAATLAASWGQTPLESPHTSLGAPLLLNRSPCFLYLQPEIPIGIQVGYNAGTGSADIQAAVAKSSGTTGFAVGYDENPDEQQQRISFAGAQTFGPLAVGSDINLIVSRKFNASVGLSAGHAFPGKQLLSLNVSNLMVTDTTLPGQEPTARLDGDLTVSEKLAMSAGIEAGARFIDLRKRQVGAILGVQLQKEFFASHALTIYGGGYGETLLDRVNVAVIDAGLGTRLALGSAGIGFYAGYAYDYYRTHTAANFSILVNPTVSVVRVGPSVTVSIPDSVLLLSAPPEQQRLVVSTTCKDAAGGNGLLRWILTISRDYDGHTLVRSFSGGGPAPSTIIWDGRGSNGSICESGVYFVRLSVIDRRRNLGSSEPVRVVVRN
jgi:hypothetical protein